MILRKSELSDRWSTVSLSDVVQFLDSQRKPITEKDRVPGCYPYYGANGQQDSIADYIFDEPLVLLAEDGGHFGDPNKHIAYQVEGKCWVNNHAHVLRPKKNIDIRFLCRHLEKYDVTPFVTGSTRGKLTKTAASRIPIILPPLEEQKRIAAILDKADAIRRKRKEAIALTEELLRSTFLDMFGDPVTNPKGWKVKFLDDILEVLHRYPTFYGCEYQKTGVPVLKIGCISTNGFINSDLNSYDKVTHEFSAEFPKTVVQANDLVMAVRGDTTGKIGLVPPELAGANISPNLIRLSPNYSLCKPQYLFWVLHYGKKLIEKRINNTAKKSLTATTLKKVPIPVPPIAIQEKFEDFYQKVKLVKDKTMNIEIESENIFNSLLQKAFRGEL